MGRAARGRRDVAAPVTEASLERAALRYLERYAASAQSVRRVLLRRIARARDAGGAVPSAAESWVEALLARHLASGLLDDRTYAEAKADSFRRRGGSTRRIRQVLAQKGVDADVAAAALASVDRESGADPAAAIAFAKRRRLGPFRPRDDRAGRRDRDLAALGRAGFDYETSRWVIDAPSADSLDPDERRG